LVSRFEIDYDISEWFNLEDSIQTLINSFPQMKRQFFDNIRGELDTLIRQEITIQDIDDTGTYSNSLNIDVLGSEDDPSLHIGFDPVGQEADRLPIYWKVLEFGSDPIPLVPRFKLGAWGARKLGSRLSGFNVASKIMKFGIRPHPILSKFFILGQPNGDLLGITSVTQQIIDDAGKGLINNLEIVFFGRSSTGQLLKIARIPGKGPRFISPK
jgi:hypothetical protein